jgi:hypothetical protein
MVTEMNYEAREARRAELNDQIRSAVFDIRDAEMEGLRGEAMLAVKHRLVVLKAKFAKEFK